MTMRYSRTQVQPAQFELIQMMLRCPKTKGKIKSYLSNITLSYITKLLTEISYYIYFLFFTKYKVLSVLFAQMKILYILKMRKKIITCWLGT